MEANVLTWWARDGGSAEEMLNKWFEDNKEKVILSVSQSDAGSTIASRRIVYTILYRS